MNKKELLISLRKLLTESQSMNFRTATYFLENGIREVIKDLKNDSSNTIGGLNFKINIYDKEAKNELKELQNILSNVDILLDRVYERLDRVNSKIAINRLDYSEGDTRG